MLNSIVLGQYVPVDSAVHRLDPRTKIVATLVLLAALFAVRGFAGLAGLTAFLLLVALGARVGLSYLLRGIRPLVWLVVFATVMQLLVGEPGGRVLVHWGPVTVTRENLARAAFYGWRLVLLVLATTLMTLVTSPMEFTDGLERLLRPLRRLGAHELAMMMTIALRFIPTLMEEAEVIMKAQMARGAEFARGSVAARARSLIPLLVPLFVGAFRRADQLAIAMEARCYRGGDHRTRMRVLRFGPRDALAVVILLAVAVAAVLVSRGLPGPVP